MSDARETVREVVFAVLPVTLVVVFLQLTVIRMPFADFFQFLIGVAFVMLGLIMFLVGVHIGLLPVGELIGATLPRTGKVWLVLFFGFLLGFVVTVAEPDVRVLATQVELVSEGQIGKNILIYAVALGVAIFVGLAMLRIIYNISLTYILVGGYSAVLLLAYYTPMAYVPISLDAGGVTTGPMTVPFILALGVGVSSVLRGKTSSSDGFGLIALASIGPILAVLLLGVIYG